MEGARLPSSQIYDCYLKQEIKQRIFKYNFFIALPIQMKIDRFNDFLFYTRQNVRA